MIHRRLASALALSLALGCAAARPVVVAPVVAPPAGVTEALPWGDTALVLDRQTGVAADDGRLARPYAVDLAAGQRVRFTMRSRAFDARLLIEGPGALRLENDDAFPGSTDASLTFEAPAAGRYTVRATTFNSGESGPFTLRAERLPAHEGIALATGATTDAVLTPGNGERAPGQWFHFTARGGSRVRLLHRLGPRW